MKEKSGFTLIELMIVITIIGIVAAIAIPSMMRARLEANEVSAIQNLQAVATAQIGFHATRHTFGDFAALTQGLAGGGPPFLPEDWQEGSEKSGYLYSMTAADIADFECFADPVIEGATGNRFFRIDSTGVTRFEYGGRPNGASSPVD